MFFYLSKILWVAAAPSNLLVVGFVLATLLIARHTRQRRLLAGLAVALLVASFSPLGVLLLVPLELRFPQPDLTDIQPAGIIVLGGPINPTLGAVHNAVHLGEGAERLTSAVALARRYPAVPLIYTGGTNAVVLSEGSEAADAKRLLVSLGIAAERIVLEDRSRNTAENASKTREIVRPAASGVRYLLVTSAFHMPRAVGLFRRAGLSVIPFPVDYRTTATLKDLLPAATAAQGLGNLDFAVREWVGLAAYFFSGKIDVLLPGPEPNKR